MRSDLWKALAGALLAGAARGEAEGAGLLKREARLEAESYAYQVHVPPGAARGEKLPVIIFLHGIKQRGAGGFVPTSGAGGALVRQQLARVPAIVLLPHCRPGSYWSDALMERMVMRALEQTLEEFGGDARRVYLTGVSMGGYGVWHVASRHPYRFAALVSICGGSPLRAGDRFQPVAKKIGRDTPVWLFHGAEDRVVPVEESRRMVEALRRVGNSHARYSEYEGVGHNVWLKALGESELLAWLLAQRLEEGSAATAARR